LLTVVLTLWDLALKDNKLSASIEGLATGNRFAVGNDLVFIPDFQTSLTDVFKAKVYTKNETAYCDQFADALLRYASTWAAKEAVYKALKQIDKTAIGWKKIEIIREKIAGQPNVIIHRDSVNFKISLTISHDGDYVWAVAFIEIN
jgi:holo-[acyl-carrier protein] synthase